MWKRAAGRKLSVSRINSVTSESSQNSKSITFDVAEAEALMNEFGIAAPLSGLGSIQVYTYHITIQKDVNCFSNSHIIKKVFSAFRRTRRATIIKPTILILLLHQLRYIISHIQTYKCR